MTKQEQIKEIAKIAYKSLDDDCLENNMTGFCENCKYDCHRAEDDEYDCQTYAIAERITNAGYRQEKEVAKEILQGMLGNLHKLTGCGVPYHVRKFINEFAEKYGIELE